MSKLNEAIFPWCPIGLLIGLAGALIAMHSIAIESESAAGLGTEMSSAIAGLGVGFFALILSGLPGVAMSSLIYGLVIGYKFGLAAGLFGGLACVLAAPLYSGVSLFFLSLILLFLMLTRRCRFKRRPTEIHAE